MKTFCSGEKSINYSSFISAAKRYNLNVINPLENRTVHCLFEVKDSYLVTPDANIYKCFVSELTYMGKIKQDGEIFRNIRAKKNMAKWESFSNVDQLCKKCKVYPLCAGGCVAKKIGGKNSCPIWKKEVSKLIELEIKNHNRFSIN